MKEEIDIFVIHMKEEIDIFVIHHSRT